MSDTLTEWQQIVAASKATKPEAKRTEPRTSRRDWEQIVAASKPTPEPAAAEQVYNLFRHPFTPAPGLKKVERLIAGPEHLEGEPSFLRDVVGKTARQFASGLLPTTAAGALTFGLAGPATKGLQRLFPVLGKPVGALFGKASSRASESVAPEAVQAVQARIQPEATTHVVPPPPVGDVASEPIATLPALDPTQPSRLQTWRQYASQAWQRLKDQLPSELPLIKRVPSSPVISDVERMGVQTGTRLERLIQDPLTDELWKYTPDQWFAYEAQAVRIWQQGGRTPEAYAAAVQSLPPAFRQMVSRRTDGLAGDQAARAAMDLGELPEVSSPYFARLTDRDAREVFEVFGQGAGLAKDLQTTVKSFQQSRVYGTAVEGMGQGVIYEDPRKAWLMREWMSIKLQETAALGQQLIGRVLFPSKDAARAASAVGEAYPIDGLPWKSGLPNHRWWATSREEALFLQQNLSRPEGRLGVAMHWANQAFRNPNLVNPLPHVVKNMWVKYAMARGSLNPAPLIGDAREYVLNGNPALIRQFQAVMPFTEHGETTHQLLLQAVGSPMAKALNVLGQLNKLSSKFIFAYADPAMRYSLWKWYLGKGLTPQEAANNVWVDLIRYGTRSELVDTWKSIPMNFFVPWRVGSWTAIIKNLSGAHAPSRLMTGAAAKGVTFALSPAMRPVRTAMIIGAVELAREAYFRDTGRTFHIPFDYVDGPLTKIVDDPKQAAYIAATMLMLGPGGEAAAKNIADSLNALRGKPEWDKVKQLYWGLAQAYHMGQDLSDAIQHGDTHAMLQALKIAALAEHDTYGYTPDHLVKYLPEWLPAMEKAQLVKDAELRRAAIKAIGEQKAIRRQRIREATLPPSQRP